MARVNILDLVIGQRGEDVVTAFDLKGVSAGCSIMNSQTVMASQVINHMHP